MVVHSDLYASCLSKKQATIIHTMNIILLSKQDYKRYMQLVICIIVEQPMWIHD